jgi:hypothetical protein
LPNTEGNYFFCACRIFATASFLGHLADCPISLVTPTLAIRHAIESISANEQQQFLTRVLS